MNKLKFIGTGSCFNTELGNTSAYILLENGELLLFDCGESVFNEIMKLHILDDITSISVIITHLHSDHVGSLPSLIFYLAYTKKIRPKIYFPLFDLRYFLKVCGVPSELYEYSMESNSPYYTMRAFKVPHVPKLNSFSYMFEFPKLNTTIYYSGDAKEIPADFLAYFKKNYNKKNIYMYHEVTRYTNDAHMHIEKLAKLFSEKERKNITCMHFDDEATIEMAKIYEFNVATI